MFNQHIEGYFRNFVQGDEAAVIERLQQVESNLNSTSRTLLSRMDIKDASNAKKLLVCFCLCNFLQNFKCL